MDPRFGAFNVTTAVLVLLTVWLIVARVRGAVDTNWGLVYYLGVVFYSTIFPGFLGPAWVYSGVVCSLLLRFEFMGGVFLKVIRVLDVVVLGYIAVTAFSGLTIL